MQYVCKQCNVYVDIYDPDKMEKHIAKYHGEQHVNDLAWKKRNLAIEENGKLYNVRQ